MNPPKPTQQFKYGDRPTWKVVLDAVTAIGSPASTLEILRQVHIEVPDFVETNVGPDLCKLTVNSLARGNHAGNQKPRRTDEGHPSDRLIQLGSRRNSLYTLYQPEIHGIWALEDVGDKVLRPRFLSAPDAAELQSAQTEVTEQGLFDPTEDARRRVMAAIVQREGQPAFRRALLDAYGGTCAISGCTVEALLEAAHIVPYTGAHTNSVTNGLLLRADLHKLFDLHLFRIDPDTRTIHLSSALKGSEYECFENSPLHQPSSPDLAPLSEALKHHEDRCAWLILTADVNTS